MSLKDNSKVRLAEAVIIRNKKHNELVKKQKV